MKQPDWKPDCGPDTDVAAHFRQAMRLHVAGVCIVSVGRGEKVNGMVATAVTSFSLDPPSLLVCINQSASIASQLVADGHFGVTLLAQHHAEIATTFSGKPSGRSRFDHGPWRFSQTAPPLLEDAAANLICRLAATLSYATHHALIGRVERVTARSEMPTLLYGNGAYRGAGN